MHRCLKKVVLEGFGLFAAKKFKKDEFIGCYSSELLTKKEEDKRAIIIETTRSSYFFHSINVNFYLNDARSFGNYTRFINHLPTPGCNCSTSETINEEGRSIILFHCKRDVEEGEEFFFDYGEQFNLAWKNEWGY